MVVAADYTATGRLLDKQTLYPALQQVILALGALGVQVDATGTPKAPGKFVRLPTILLDEAVSFVSTDKSMDELVQDCFARGFEFGTSTPLWHVTVVYEKTVLFHYDHVIGDGQSGMAFHSALLSALNNPSSDTKFSGHAVDIPATPSLVPPIEAMTKTSPSAGLYAHAIYETFVPASCTKARKIWTGNRIVRAPTTQTNIRSWQIPAEQGQKLVALCRAHDTTLTGFLRTLVAVVLANVLQAQPKPVPRRYKTISTQIPVSLRRFSGASPHVMCNHVSSVPFALRIASAPRLRDPGTPFPWAAAAQFSAALRTAVHAQARQVVGLLRFLVRFGLMDAYYTGALGKKREGSLEFSNLGRFPAPPADAEGKREDAQWTVGNVYFAQCDAVKGAAVKNNIAGSPDGAVTVVHSWGKGAVDDELAETLVRDVKAAFARVLESSAAS